MFSICYSQVNCLFVLQSRHYVWNFIHWSIEIHMFNHYAVPDQFLLFLQRYWKLCSWTRVIECWYAFKLFISEKIYFNTFWKIRKHVLKPRNLLQNQALSFRRTDSRPRMKMTANRKNFELPDGGLTTARLEWSGAVARLLPSSLARSFALLVCVCSMARCEPFRTLKDNAETSSRTFLFERVLISPFHCAMASAAMAKDSMRSEESC